MSSHLVRQTERKTRTGGAAMLLETLRKRQLRERVAFGQGCGPGEYVASDETGQLRKHGAQSDSNRHWADF